MDLNKRIEGSFANPERLQEEIQRFLDQGFAASQLTILTRQDEVRSSVEHTGVPVVVTSDSSSGDTFWDRIVSFFTVEMDDEDEEEQLEERVDEEDVFEEFGIARSTYQRFEEALDEGEYLLLVDEGVPEQQQVSDFLIRDGIVEEEEISMNENKKDQERKAAKPDWVDNDSTKGDVNAHSANAEKDVSKKTIDAQHQAAHPDPQPGVTEGDNVEAEIPQSQHPDPVVDEEGNEVVQHNKEGNHPGKALDQEGSQPGDKDTQLQYDEQDSNPQHQDDADQVSTDPFGGNPEKVAQGEGSEGVEPEYDDSDHTPPAL